MLSGCDSVNFIIAIKAKETDVQLGVLHSLACGVVGTNVDPTKVDGAFSALCW